MRNHITRVLMVTLAAVLAFSAAAAYAQESFQYEVSGLFGTVDDTIDRTNFGVSGEYFFEPVNTKNHPYREAAFLERIGSVLGTIQMIDESGARPGDGPLYGLGVNYAKPDFPFVFQAAYTWADIDFDQGGNEEDKALLLRAGNYFTDNLLAGVEYSDTEADIAQTGFPTTTDQITGYGVFAKYVGPMTGQTMGLNGSIGTGKRDDGNATFDNINVAVAGDYYFTRALSAGLGVAVSSGDDRVTEGTTWTLKADYFFTPRYSVKVTYDMFSNDNAGFKDEDTLNAAVAARF